MRNILADCTDSIRTTMPKKITKLIKEALKNAHLYTEEELTYLRQAKKRLKNEKKINELKNSK